MKPEMKKRKKENKKTTQKANNCTCTWWLVDLRDVSVLLQRESERNEAVLLVVGRSVALTGQRDTVHSKP